MEQFLLISMMLCFVMFIKNISPILFSKIPSLELFIDQYGLILNYIRYILIFISLVAASCLFYCIIPNVNIKFIDVIPGSILVSLLWIFLGIIFSRYLSYYTQLNIVYGSLGGIIVTLLFFYIVNMIFIIGAEYNAILIKENRIK
ncbi:MAG TPA: YihY/virulence factor BrkB family protein [Candidatus Megaira endosymbiont of Hartmannula sinica]|nr:YihY/virulence factor BrkB family protein [Candidatus Megaera endosymbiont of Hartmannula sinica]